MVASFRLVAAEALRQGFGCFRTTQTRQNVSLVRAVRPHTRGSCSSDHSATWQQMMVCQLALQTASGDARTQQRVPVTLLCTSALLIHRIMAGQQWKGAGVTQQ